MIPCCTTPVNRKAPKMGVFDYLGVRCRFGLVVKTSKSRVYSECVPPSLTLPAPLENYSLICEARLLSYLKKYVAYTMVCPVDLRVLGRS